MRFVLSAFFIGFCAVVFSGLGLAWDGAYQLVYVLENGAANVGYGRYTQAGIFAAVLALSRFTDRINDLVWFFGALHAALPFASLLGAWIILRRRAPHLFLWVVLGIGLITLPAQACLVCQSVGVVQLMWVLVAAVLVGMPRVGALLSLVAVPLMLFYHPVAILCFGVAAALSFWVGLRERASRRRMFAWGAFFIVAALAAVARMYWFRSSYESEQMALDVWVRTFESGVAGVPLQAILLVWLAAFAVWLDARAAHFTRVLRAAAIGCILVALALLVEWALDAAAWQYAVEYRSWAIWLTLPLALAAALDRRPPSPVFRERAAYLVSIGFVLVLVAQASVYGSVQDRLRVALAQQAGCVEARHIEGLPNTALAGWTITAQSLLVQGKRPHALAYYWEDCASPDRGFQWGYFLSNLGSWDFYRWGTGWFDKTQLRDTLGTPVAGRQP